MKNLFILIVLTLGAQALFAQDVANAVFRTEKLFERAVVEKGINKAFIEFLSPTGIMFLPDAVNAREAWSKRPESTAALTWNPIWIDVSANGVLAYSIGNSQFRPKGKDDNEVYYGHYISVWVRQLNGEFRAALDTGINHEKPAAAQPAEWKSPTGGSDLNADKISAADSAVGFYQMAQESGAVRAYKRYLAKDVIVMRQGKFPAFEKRSALVLVKETPHINFAKRKSFTEAADLGYVNSPYNIVDEAGDEIERGNFVQVWKLRNGKWQIVADVLVPLPKLSN